MSRRSLPGDDTNQRRLLGYSLAPGSHLRNHPEMRVAHRWRKPLGSSSFRDRLWLQTSPPWRKCLKTRQLRLLLRLHRRRGKTRSGGCARSCETRTRCSPPLSNSCYRIHLLSLSWREGPPAPFLVTHEFFYRQSIFNMHSPLTSLHPHPNDSPYNFPLESIQLALLRAGPTLPRFVVLAEESSLALYI